ncbi:MAG TPA: hypothetical protein VHB79_37155 [Polyangiaceae bacterium]|nr:hypothetical protein [Polyangiaceae bacterium]
MRRRLGHWACWGIVVIACGAACARTKKGDAPTGEAGASGSIAAEAGESDGGTGGTSGSAARGGAGGGSAGIATMPTHGGMPPMAEPGDEPCVQSLEELNALGGFACPATWCAGRAQASDCAALSSDVQQSGYRSCPAGAEVQLELLLASGATKLCHYSVPVVGPLNTAKADPQLSAIELFDTQASYCDGSSKHATSSTRLPACDVSSTVLCVGSESKAPQAAKETCFDAFSHSCGECCPDPTPSCTGGPQDFPNGSCVSNDNPYCSCGCQDGTWTCAC